MNCKNCGKPTGIKANGREFRKFCKDPACVKDYMKRRAENGIALDTQILTKSEAEFRQLIFQQAKEGSGDARHILAKRYNLTAFWDGERLVALSACNAQADLHK